MKKKLLAIVAAMAMVVAMVPSMVFADATDVAQIGTKTYSSLQEAIDKAYDGDEIKIISNINVKIKDNKDLARKYATLFNVEGKKITIDLNGKRIEGDASEVSGKGLVGMFSTENGGELVLNDTVGGAIVEVKANDGTVYGLLVNFDNTSKITINGGNYIADKVTDSLIYTGGSKDKDGEYLKGIIVNGGTFKLGNIGKGLGGNGSPWIFNASGQNTSHVIVNGGTFNDDINHQYYPFEADVPKEKALKNNGDGTWTVVPAVAYVTEQEWSSRWYTHEVGYATVKEAIEAAKKNKSSLDSDPDSRFNTTITRERKKEEVKVTLFVASLNDKSYESISKAVDAAIIDGETINVLVDSESIEKEVDAVEGADKSWIANHKIYETVLIDKSINFDFKDNIMKVDPKADPAFRIQNEAKVTMKGNNGGVDARNNVSYAFIVGAKDGSSEGELNIEGGKHSGTVSVASVTKGVLNITGGEFKVDPYMEPGNTKENYNYLLNCIDDNYKDGSASIVVKGGKYYGFDPENNAAEGEGTDFVPEGYKSVEEPQGVWTVESIKPAQPDTPADTKGKKVDTGDDSGLTFTLVLAGLALAAMAAVACTRRREN